MSDFDPRDVDPRDVDPRDFDPQLGRALPRDPAADSARSTSDDHDLQDGLNGLATIVAGSFAMADLLARVAEFATRAIPGVDGAGVTLLRSRPGGRPAQLEAVGATADFVRAIDEIQYDLVDEGPCLACHETGRPAVSGSLGSDQRWPRFGGRVARLGVHSALSLPLSLSHGPIGAINAYAHDRDVFTEHAVRLGEEFARPAAVAVHNASVLAAATAEVDKLQEALGSRAMIDQAIGIVRSRSGGSADEAFERLRAISQTENTKLTVVANRLVDDAVRRVHARQGSR